MEETSTMTAYVHRLQNNLQWDPIQGVEDQAKNMFVEALTEIAALPLDSINMEIRRLLVVFNSQATMEETSSETPLLYLRNIIAALSARDVLLKCKAANAVGSLCISRVAGQQLLQLYGHEIMQSVAKMATRKNQWVQGDAFFVLGWMVVIADDVMLRNIAELLPTVVECLHRNLKLPLEMESTADEASTKAAAWRSKLALVSSEQASNFRIYALVLLLNCSQRYVDVFVHQLEKLLAMLRDLLVKLLESAPSVAPASDSMTILTTIFFEPTEYAEVLKLTITLLSVLTDQLDKAASQLLELKTLPVLLKLKQIVDKSEVRELVGEVDCQDIAIRLEAIVQLLLNSK